MFIDLENIKTANTLFKYLDKGTKYTFRSDYFPWRSWLQDRHNYLSAIEHLYLGLDIDVPDKVLFYPKSSAREDEYKDQQIIKASDYLRSVSKKTIILLNKEV